MRITREETQLDECRIFITILVLTACQNFICNVCNREVVEKPSDDVYLSEKQETELEFVPQCKCIISPNDLSNFPMSA